MKNRFRTPVVLGLQALLAVQGSDAKPVDREKGIIRGASAMQAVEALGHGVLIDAVALGQVRDFGNSAAKGAKSRFTHPGMCSDGMGKMLGRMQNFRIEGDKVVGDLHLADSASRTPEGDLRGYVLDLAEEDPSAFGMSVVISTFRVWKLTNGTEIRTDDDSLKRGSGWDVYYERPTNATTESPFVRVTELHAVDVVDEPAANRDGLFSAFSGTTNADAELAFEQIDALRDRMNLSPEKAREFIDRYFASRSPIPTTTKDQPVKLSAQVFAALILANLPFAKELGEFSQDPANKDADESAFNAKLADLKSLADKKAVADIKAELAAEKAGRATDRADFEKKLATVHTALAAESKRADGLAALGTGAIPGSKVGGDHTVTDLGGLTGAALFTAEWERATEELKANFGGDFKAYSIHRKEGEAKKAKG